MKVTKDQFAKLTKIKFSTEELVDIAIDFLYSQFNTISADIPLETSEEPAPALEKKNKKKPTTTPKNNQKNSTTKMNFLSAGDIGVGLSKSESEELKQAKTDDQKNKKTFKQPPKRPSALADVCCRVCGKREKVSPVLFTKPDRYKCNGCCMAACDTDNGKYDEDNE